MNETTGTIAANIVGFSIILLFLAGITFFTYRYLLAKRLNTKARGFDIVGLLFFVFAFVSGCSGVVGKLLDSAIPNDNVRFLISFVILIFIVGLTTLLARQLVDNKLKGK